MKLTEITPSSMRCMVGPCPAIYETDRDTYVVIGVRLSSEQITQFLQGKVGIDEAAVELPKKVLKDIIQNKS